MPIRVCNETSGHHHDCDHIEWILNCESTKLHGFAGPDQRALQDLNESLQTTLEIWFETQLSEALLQRVQQGVLVTDGNGRIERCNDTALRLLSVPIGEHLTGRQLDEFAADHCASAVLRREASVPLESIKLRTASGEEKPILVAREFAPDAFNRWVWLLSDVTEQSWQASLSYARAIAQEVAQQTRGPLLLAYERIAKLLRSDGLPEEAVRMLSKAGKNIVKADITYERLAGVLWARQAGRIRGFDLAQMLREFRETLPDRDRAAIEFRFLGGEVQAVGHPERIRAALRSLLGYLIGVHANGSLVLCEIVRDRGRLCVTLSARGAVPRSTVITDGMINDLQQSARETVMLNFYEAQAAFVDSGGSLRRPDHEDTVVFAATLPMPQCAGLPA